MKSRTFWTPALLLAGGLMFGATQAAQECDTAPALADPATVGHELVNTYISLLAAGQTEGLDGLLSEAFMIQRADGSFATRSEYLANYPEIGRFSITNVSARQDGNVLVVHWYLAVDEVIDGRTFSNTPAPRLSSFAWSDGAWRLTSHANFNVPVVDR